MIYEQQKSQNNCINNNSKFWKLEDNNGSEKNLWGLNVTLVSLMGIILTFYFFLF